MTEQNQTITHPHPLLIPLMAGGLSNLTDAELTELDEMITPRTAELLTKAFGADMAMLLDPLIANEQTDNTDSPPADNNHDMRAKLRELMRDPRYWRDKNPEFLKMVADGFAQLP